MPFNLVRIFYHPDGSISINRPNLARRLLGETDEVLLDRLANDAVAKDPRLQGLSYDDLTEDDLPDRDNTDRDQWLGSQGNGIHVDETKETGRVVLGHYEQELAKSNPDQVKVQQLRRKLEKRDYFIPESKKQGLSLQS